MASDPGDLVLDPTCGFWHHRRGPLSSGAAAGLRLTPRRVALALARARIMGRAAIRFTCWPTHATGPNQGSRSPTAPPRRVRSLVQGNIRHGFVYERRATHSRLKSIANQRGGSMSSGDQWQAKAGAFARIP